MNNGERPDPDDVNVDGKTVLLRVDINSPLDPGTRPSSTTPEFEPSFSTLQRLVRAKVILLAHQSRPGKDDFTSTLGHARELGRLLGRQVKWVNDIHGPKAMEAIEQLEIGQLLMLNNVRMDEEEVYGERGFHRHGETHLVQRLASVADLFVNDAFACAHRSTPSIVGFTGLLPCVAGELMGNELRKLDHALLETPERPCLAVLGGVKVDDSVQVADNMLRNGIADELWPTGGVANLMLDLAGFDIGEPNRAFLKKELENWATTVHQAQSFIHDHGDKIHLPVDLAANIEGNRDIPLDDFPIEAPFWDIGIKSVFHLSAAIRRAGPSFSTGLQACSSFDFALGTIEMLNACAESDGYAVMGAATRRPLWLSAAWPTRWGTFQRAVAPAWITSQVAALPAVVSLEQSAVAFGIDITSAERKV